MKLPIAIHKDEGSTYGVTVPDVPGCFSFGESIEEAIANTEEAVLAHLELLLGEGAPAKVQASPITALQQLPDHTGAVWALVDIDLSRLDPTPARVNISLPRHVLERIDAYTKAHHETRSGFLARAAMNAMTS